MQLIIHVLFNDADDNEASQASVASAGKSVPFTLISSVQDVSVLSLHFFFSRNIPSSFNTSIYSNLFVIYLSVGLVSIRLYSMLQNIWILIMSCIACVGLYDAVSII